jgi:N-acetyl-alpha-D-glucosaminyl L-malate synthase BshA
VTSVSQSLKEDTLKFFQIRKEIEVVPNFIDCSKYDKKEFTDCQREMMADKKEKIITHISNFRKVKRIDDVIKIFYEIQKKIDAKLMMVGEGPEKEMAEDLAEELHIEDKVMFLGQSHEIDKILCFSDLFLLPSEKESFGLSALEAMVNGVAVISTNTGGLPEVNQHGISGYLSNVGDIEEMASNALKILQNEKILEKFKQGARDVAEKFDIKNVVPLYEDIYTKALQVKA